MSSLSVKIKVLGVSRLFRTIDNVHGQDIHVIPDTLFTEDLHFHPPSNQLFGASETDEKTRNTWFPPLTKWGDHRSIGQGSIVVINAKTFACTRLKLVGFDGPFNTHGIDICSPANDPESVYILAVNHLPNPEYYNATTATRKMQKIPRARSRLELFHHEIGTLEATHIRSIWHPLIRTPNDVLFKALNEIYVTNDHLHREGIKRVLEDLAFKSVGSTDLIHLTLANPFARVTDDAEGVMGKIANRGIHNNNGLARGRTPTEIAICRTAMGQLLLTEQDRNRLPALKIKHTIQLPCTLDSPAFFCDPYVKKTGRDASGYVVAGLARAITYPNGLDPVMVWLVQPSVTKNAERWKGTLIFQDDGHILRSASAAVLVAIDPDTNEGKKQANLFVTGPLGKGVVVSKIDI